MASASAHEFLRVQRFQESWRRVAFAGLLLACGCSDKSGSSYDAHADGNRSDMLASCAPQDLSSCFVGAAFAECASQGSAVPRLYCSTLGTESCLWISNGCPAGNYRGLLQADCSCAAPECPFPRSAFVFAYGRQPWDRVRARILPVSIDRGLQVGTTPEVSCQGCSGTCQSFANPCLKQLPLAPLTLVSQRRLPGTFVQIIDVKEAFAGIYLQIEVDVKASPALARACRLQRSDNPPCDTPQGFPDCATSGKITLSVLPDGSNYQSIKGRFTLAFQGGLVMSGSF